ncbi:MAG: DUF1801 domain-containing protein [Armatimonadota bacterium]
MAPDDNDVPETTPRLLSGGNPQVPKGDGDAPVAAYIAALTGWRQEVVRDLDALIVACVPDVRKAVRWNSPFYGIDGQGWIVGVHVFAKAVKVTFFNGVALDPVVPGGTGKEARWFDVREGAWDPARMESWIRQAAELPGWKTG